MAASSTNALGFDDYFERAEVNIFRLETLQCYGNAGEDPARAAFETGKPHLITPAKREWITLVRDRIAAGCTMQRVHVVKEPITEYLRFELTWSYQPNVAAGEDIQIVSVTPGCPWPGGLLERTDFWMFDYSVLYALRYDRDGSWIATEQVTEESAIQRARRWRETALQLAMPWQRYIALCPELAQIVPQGEFRAR